MAQFFFFPFSRTAPLSNTPPRCTSLTVASSNVRAYKTVVSDSFGTMESTNSTDPFAYVTLVTSDDFVLGAQLLAYSLRKQQCKEPLLCIVTPNLTPHSLQLLTASSYTLLLVHPLPCPFRSHVSSWSAVGLTKLRIFSLTRYSRLLYIDADCLVLQNLDHLFRTPHSPTFPFAAAPDISPPDRFNAGVLLLAPDLRLYQHMIESLPAVGSWDGGDTGYLNNLFPGWYAADVCCRLPFRYNALRVMEWWTRKAPGYWDVAVGEVSILHYCSSPKVWEARKGGKLEQLWWSMHDEWQQAESGKQTSQQQPAVIDLRQRSVLPVFSSPLLPFPASMLSVSFDTASTKRPIHFGMWSPDDHSWLSLLRARYERQARQLNTQQDYHGGNGLHASLASLTLTDPHNRYSSFSPPRHIHAIWLGSPLPARLERWLTTFRLHHPTWQHTLHTSLDSFPHSCPPSSPLHPHLTRLMLQATNYAEQSDILRLDVLLAYGGLYVDCDFECFAPFDALHNSSLVGLYCGMSNTGTVELNNGLIGARAGHPLLRRSIERMCTRETSAGEEQRSAVSAMDIISRTGPGHFTRVVMEYVSSAVDGGAEDVLLLPPTFFYPLANTLRGLQMDEERALFRRPESLCMHHWACSWQKAEANTNGGSSLVDGSSSSGIVPVAGHLQTKATLPAKSVRDSDGEDDVQRVRQALAVPDGRVLPAGVLSRIGQFI